MSKPHDKTQGPAQETAAPTGATDLALVQPAKADQKAPAAPLSDAFHGRGGLYRMVGGVRTRVAVTQPAETQKADAKEAKQ